MSENTLPKENARGTIGLVWLIGTLAVVSLLGIALWYLVPASHESIIVILAAFAFIGVYPLTYIAYRAFRENAQRKRLKDDFRLLGLVSEKELNETVENLYLTVYSPTQFTIYIFLTILFASMILASFLNQTPLVFADRETLMLVFFAFLGAYVFSIQELVRRYNTFDVQPQVYSSILMRMILAVVITFTGAAVIRHSVGDLVNQTQNGTASAWSSDTLPWAMVLAFVIGSFPKRGLSWFSKRTSTILGETTDIASERPLSKIIGISTWHEARLAEMGIDDAQNLATVDIRKLLLTTQFDTQEIIHWIDQAILYVKVGEKIDRYRDIKIATFSELRSVIKGLSLEPFQALSPEKKNQRVEDRKRVASVLGLTEPEELERLADYSNYPNYIHIAEYYSRTATVARQRADAAMDLLLGALEETDYERAIEDGEKLRSQNPDDPKLLLRLGTAYYHLGRSEEAQEAYTKAIKLDPKLSEAYYSRSVIHAEGGNFEEAIRDASDAISITPAKALAYNNRGLAYMKMGYFDRALDDLDKALEFDARLAAAYFNRGVLYNALGNFEVANKDLEITHLLGYSSKDLWVSWGNALLGLGRYGDAVDKYSKAVLYDTDLAMAYANRGYAYLQMGSDYDYQARNDFLTAIKLNGQLTSAFTNLGLLEARIGKNESAIENYREALDLDADLYTTRYNLALAYLKQMDNQSAITEFKRVIEDAPAGSSESIDSHTFIMEIEKNMLTVSQQDTTFSDAKSE